MEKAFTAFLGLGTTVTRMPRYAPAAAFPGQAPSAAGTILASMIRQGHAPLDVRQMREISAAALITNVFIIVSAMMILKQFALMASR